MTYAKIFAIVFIAVVSSYLTREFFPRRVMDKPSISISPVYRRGAPPDIKHSFEGTEIFDLLEKERGLVGDLRAKVSELTDKITTLQNLPPDTVIIYETSIPSSTIKRTMLHHKIDKGLFTADLADISDSTAKFVSWKRDNVENDYEAWVMQNPDLPPAEWIRLDEKRNLFDLILLSPGYSTRDGPFLDFAKFRAWKLHGKGRGLEDGIYGETWVDWMEVL